MGWRPSQSLKAGAAKRNAFFLRRYARLRAGLRQSGIIIPTANPGFPTSVHPGLLSHVPLVAALTPIRYPHPSAAKPAPAGHPTANGTDSCLCHLPRVLVSFCAISRLMLGTVCGLAYGALSAASMLPLTFPDKQAALLGAFINRFSI